MITNELILLRMTTLSLRIWPTDQSLTNWKSRWGKPICDQGKGNADYALFDEVHFLDLLLFIINNSIIIRWQKMPGQKSKRYIIQELKLVIRINFEKASEFQKDVLEKIHRHNLRSNFHRQWLQILGVDAGKAVIGLMIQKIHLNLRSQAPKQWLIRVPRQVE